MKERATGHTQVRTWLVLLLFALSAVAYLDRTNVSIAGPALKDELGIDNIRLGWVQSAFLVGYAAFQVIGGWLAVRFGPRRTLAAGVLWWGIFSALVTVLHRGLAHELGLLIAIRFLLGAGEAVMYPASSQFVARWIPMSERGRANGWIFAGVGAGAGLSIPVLTWLLGQYGWRSCFWFAAVIGVAAGAAWYWASRDTPEQHPSVGAEELELIQSARPGETEDAGSAKSSWTEVLLNRSVAALSLSYFTYGYVAWIFFSWFFTYLLQVRGLDLKSSGYYSMIPFLAMVAGCLGGGAIVDALSRRVGRRMGRCGVAGIALAVSAVFLVVGAQVSGARVAAVILAGGAGALYLSQSSYWAVSVDIAGPRAGVVSGVMNMAGQIGGAVTASLTPWIAGRFGWTTAFYVAAGLAVIGGAMWLVVDPKPAAGAA